MVFALLGGSPGVGAADQPRATLEKDADHKPPRAVAGEAGCFRIKSAVLNETRNVLVALPASFSQTARRYPVILTFDGEYMIPEVHAAAAYLAQEGQIPEAIVVGIENSAGPNDRVRDLTPPGLSVSGSGLNEGGDRFLDFIERELLPALESQFRATKPCVLVGLSSGAILTTYAGATRGSSIPFIVALDAPAHLDNNWLPARMMARAAKDVSPPLRFVTLECRFGWTDQSWEELQAAAPKSWHNHREKLARESHNSMRMLGSYLGLRIVFDDYSMLNRPVLNGGPALAYYQSLEKDYGAPQAPPLPYLRQLLDEQMGASRAADAQAVLTAMNSAYGPHAKTAEWEAKIKEIASRPPPKESVESLLKTPPPTSDEIKKYLGEWTGQAWVNDGPKHPISLRVFIDNGKVKSELIHFPEPGTTLRQPGEYLRVTEKGLEFGHMNGMYPRGVIIFDGQLKENVLEGTSKIRGVEFSYPKGVTPPVHHFRLEKKQ
jgi:hypothetical protein